MKSRMSNCIIITISIILIFLSFSGLVAASYGQPQESTGNDNENNVVPSFQQTPPLLGEKKPIHINIFSSNKFSPELPAHDEGDKVAQCADGFVRTGRFGFGIIPTGHTEWRLVGNWETTLKGPLNAGDQFKFNAWVRNKGNPNFAVLGFILYKNDDEIVRAETNDFSNQLSETPKNVEASKVGSVNLTPFQSGDTLRLRIECRINGDGTEMLYGSYAHDTGTTLNCDALNIIRVHGSKDGLCLIYSDSFFVTPAKMVFISKVDDVILDTLPEYGLTDDGYRETHWDYSLRPGTHTVEVLMSYGGTDNTTMASFVGTIDIPREQKLELFGLDILIWFQIIGVIVVVGILAAIGVYIKRRREKKLLQEYLEAS